MNNFVTGKVKGFSRGLCRQNGKTQRARNDFAEEEAGDVVHIRSIVREDKRLRVVRGEN